MTHLIKIETKFGFIDVFANEDKTIIYAIPNGYIGPGLIKNELKFLRHFDSSYTHNWKYIVDVSKVTIVNPVNPFLLNGLKDLSNMNEYIVYAPSPVVRLMLRVTSWINKPDKIINEKESLQLELKKKPNS